MIILVVYRLTNMFILVIIKVSNIFILVITKVTNMLMMALVTTTVYVKLDQPFTGELMPVRTDLT